MATGKQEKLLDENHRAVFSIFYCGCKHTNLSTLQYGGKGMNKLRISKYFYDF
jgi:hypothetical protein